MFIRKKKNRSGTTSVVIVNKSNGVFREVKTIGVGKDDVEVEALCQQGGKWISSYLGEQDIFAIHDKEVEEKQVTEYLLSNIENILLNGVQLILNQAFRYLDKLHDTQQEKLQQISVEHTRRILGGKIGLMFYDVTTLYFETDYGDELRETGFSKDGKHSQPQIVLGLLVSKDGYPLSYSIFNGSQYEGKTMLPVVEDFINRFKLEDFVIVADSGLMNQKNVELLESSNYKYIIGARIKNESSVMKDWILSLEKQNGTFYETAKGNARLIVGYSENRAKKDRYNRDKGVRRLEKAYKRGKITKENINKRGYNKFLTISDNVIVSISPDKIIEDQKWDGLKGYLTNTDLPANEVYEQYSGLWAVERAFRITKGKLKISNINLSVDKVLSIAEIITTIKINLPISGNSMTKTMLLTKRHLSIARLFDENFWKSV